MIKNLLWKFDIFVYRLFYWRWNDKFKNRADIRKLFFDFLNVWETFQKEPITEIGNNPFDLERPRKKTMNTITSKIGDSQVKLSYDGRGLRLSKTCNGENQWTSFNVDDQMLSIIRDVIDKYFKGGWRSE